MDDQVRRPDQPQQFETESEETFTRPVEPSTPTPPPQEPMQVKKKSGAKKWLLWGVVLVLLASAGAFSYWQWSEAESTKKELSSAQAELQAVKNTPKQEPSEDKDTPTSSKPSFTTFIAEYNKFAATTVQLTDADKKAVEAAIKDYYKLSAMPAGWQIVTAYKGEKTGTATTEPVNALVFWPASETKPAGFFEVTKSSDGKWAYNEQR